MKHYVMPLRQITDEKFMHGSAKFFLIGHQDMRYTIHIRNRVCILIGCGTTSIAVKIKVAILKWKSSLYSVGQMEASGEWSIGPSHNDWDRIRLSHYVYEPIY